MKKNVGAIDKVVRLFLVVLIVALYFTHLIGGLAAIILGIFAVVFLLTSLVSICPLYMLLGISTAKKQ
ncbi:MAG: DUF2892 domain-containing protein [Chitinivibrionales bacterium]